MIRLLDIVLRHLGLFLLVLSSSVAFDLTKGESPATGYRLSFTQQQRQTADQIISVFENNSTELQYGYAKKLRDGRGITAGRAGFTSATGDMRLVVDQYTAVAADNPLAQYLPALKNLSTNYSSSTWDLRDLIKNWSLASEDPRFRQVQDNVVNQIYYAPALEHAAAIGAQSALTLLVLYDTIIQHGNAADKDGLPELIRCTTDRLKGTPKSGINEQQWVEEFLKMRREVLRNPTDTSTRFVWSESVGRVDALSALLNQQNMDLHTPFTLNPWGTPFVFNAPLQGS